MTGVAGQLRAIDICAGAGGWACAARGLPLRIVGAIDLWDRALATYQHNFPQVETVCGDVREASVQCEIVRRWGKMDVVLGGIPCEWLSSYHNVVGQPSAAELERNRATLDSVLGLVRDIAPRWWCLEDIIALRRELPLLTPYQILDARHWSAQRRRRLYVGVFPAPAAPASNGRVLADVLRSGPYRLGPRAQNREPRTSGTFQRQIALAADPGRKGPMACGISSRRDGEVLIRDEAIPGKWRQPEWQEWARLQGFPEDYVFLGTAQDVWRMIGQAIQIDLGREILRGICRAAGAIREGDLSETESEGAGCGMRAAD